MINTKQLQSNKESTDRWWLSGKKQKQNSCRTDSDHDEEKQGQWDKGEGSLGTDPNTLINILWLPIFYSPSLNYGHQQEAKCPNLGSKKNKIENRSKLWRRRSCKIERKQQLAPEIQGKTQHITEEKDQQGKSRGRWWPGYDPEIPQGFEESFENTKEKKQVLYSWPKLWKMDT